MRQCLRCVYFVNEPEDFDTGSDGFVQCGSVLSMDPDLPESVVERFEDLYFAMSSINNCPQFRDDREFEIDDERIVTRKKRKSILDRSSL